MSMCPSRSVSSTASADSRRDGTNKYCKFLLPQLTRNFMTFWLFFTASIISAFSRSPDSSTSICEQTTRESRLRVSRARDGDVPTGRYRRGLALKAMIGAGREP